MHDLKRAIVVITGGSDGIGRGLAAKYLAAGSAVLVTGRSKERLDALTRELPGILTFVSDVSKAEDRRVLAELIRRNMPGLDILINNAGVQRRVSLAADTAPWEQTQAEIDTVLCGPVHLNHLLVPVMLAHARPGTIVNVTSGGAFVPQTFAPVYAACKAAMHSYTLTLRHALAETPLRVVELIPPAVKTNLAGPSSGHGAELYEYVAAAFAELQRAEALTIGYGVTDSPQFREIIDAGQRVFDANSSRFPVEIYRAPPPAQKA